MDLRAEREKDFDVSDDDEQYSGEALQRRTRASRKSEEWVEGDVCEQVDGIDLTTRHQFKLRFKYRYPSASSPSIRTCAYHSNTSYKQILLAHLELALDYLEPRLILLVLHLSFDTLSSCNQNVVIVLRTCTLLLACVLDLSN